MGGMGMAGAGGSPPSWWEAHDLWSLLKIYQERRGVVRLVIREKIRRLLFDMPLSDAMDAINRLTEDKHLDILLGCGMRGALYYAVVARKAWLMGIR